MSYIRLYGRLSELINDQDFQCYFNFKFTDVSTQISELLSYGVLDAAPTSDYWPEV